MSSRSLRPKVAIIGISGYARLVLRSLLAVLESGTAELVAATIINRETEEAACLALERRGCRIFESYTRMLEECGDQLDLCLIPTGIPWHVEMCLKALSKGSNVLVEKPLAGDDEGARRILDASILAGRFVAVAFQSMYCGVTQDIKRYLISGALGEIYEIHAEGSWPRDQAYYCRNAWAGRIQIAGNPVNDSPLNNAFSHVVNLSLFFAGKAFGDCATATVEGGGLYRNFPIESYDSAAVKLGTERGIALTWAFTHADERQVPPRIRIEAEKGCLLWTYNAPAFAAAHDGETLKTWPAWTDEEARRQMLRRIIDGVVEGVPPLCDARFAMAHAGIVAKVLRELPIQNREGSPFSNGNKLSWKRQEGLLDQLKRELTLPREAPAENEKEIFPLPNITA